MALLARMRGTEMIMAAASAWCTDIGPVAISSRRAGSTPPSRIRTANPSGTADTSLTSAAMISPPYPYHPWSSLCRLVAFLALIAGTGILIHGLNTAAEQRHARRQLPLDGQGKTQATVSAEAPPV